jgi:hydrogenase maturation protein HypF
METAWINGFLGSLIMCQTDNNIENIQLRVQGRVQGVGFRPFIFHLANQFSLSGSVCNTHSGLEIKLRGRKQALERFKHALSSNVPSTANITKIEYQSINHLTLPDDFRILDSNENIDSAPEVTPDLAICSSCIKELFSPNSRRFLHPFITCTQCGPRYSIISSLPYDRAHTSMSKFEMCNTCSDEYKIPNNKRFHSQTNACHQCGPSLSLFDNKGVLIEREDELELIDVCSQAIKDGKILALKSIGGFNLICDAKNTESIQRLRKLKARPDKPLAIMALNTASLEPLVHLDNLSQTQLQSASSPIVLLPTRQNNNDHIAPGLNTLGCILPYTALHYLLFHALLDRPEGINWLSEKQDIQLIVTSANLPGDPIIFENEICFEQASDMADYILSHNRDITAPTDDSVIQTGAPSAIIRYARGYAPASLPIAENIQANLASGAHLKSTFSLVQRDRVYISPHIGDLDSPARMERYGSTLAHYQHLFGKGIRHVYADMHPDYASTQFAEKLARQNNIPVSNVQHHHAHLLSVMAENSTNISEPALGLILDGNGLGMDNQAWGGELFFIDKQTIERIGHLEELDIPGGDIAAREIWRIGAKLVAKLSQSEALSLYEKELSSPIKADFILNGKHLQTSSAGRWFDAVASIIKLRQHCTYEGQAASELEAITKLEKAKSLLEINEENILLLSPIIPHILKCEDPNQAASLFHTEFIDGLIRWIKKQADRHQTTRVYCSGGCFQNRLLRESLNATLSAMKFRVYFNKKVPANDGGISLGQAYCSSQRPSHQTQQHTSEQTRLKQE